MPALKNPSLVVLDNASYHNVKTEDAVCQNFSLKKAVLQNYLTQHNALFTSFNRKVVLFLATKPLTCAHINSIGLSVERALKNPGLVVLDNASYHNVKTEDTVCPNFSLKKAVLQNYLTQYNIP
jgi:hypothetical protein